MKNEKRQIRGFRECPALTNLSPYCVKYKRPPDEQFNPVRQWTCTHLSVPKLLAWVHHLARTRMGIVGEPHFALQPGSTFEEISTHAEHLPKFPLIE